MVVSNHLKSISQIGSFPQVKVKVKNIWNHHLVYISYLTQRTRRSPWLKGGFQSSKATKCLILHPKKKRVVWATLLIIWFSGPTLYNSPIILLPTNDWRTTKTSVRFSSVFLSFCQFKWIIQRCHAPRLQKKHVDVRWRKKQKNIFDQTMADWNAELLF